MLEAAFQNFICSVLIELFVMAYDQILNLNQINSEPGTNQKLAVFFYLSILTFETYQNLTSRLMY